MTDLSDAVDYWAENPDDNPDKVVQSVSAHGEYDNSDLVRHTFTTDDDTEHTYWAHEDLPQSAHAVVQAFIKEYQPQAKLCHSNAVELCRFTAKVDLVEGVTASDESRKVHTHAWNTWDGYPIDVTRPSPERYGVQIPNNVVQSHIPTLEEHNRWDLIENPNTPSPPYLSESE